MVITNVNQVVYQGDGVTTAFPFTFRIIDWTDIKLLLLDSDGTETDITSDYYVDTVNNTVHYPGYAPGAEPALSDRPPVLAEGQKLVIYRKLPITQEKDLGDKWPFYVIELGLDKLTMILQDIWDWLGRCLYVSKGQAYEAGDDFDPTVPLAADKVVCGNENGTGFVAREALLEVNGYWDGEGRQIRGVADPTDNQDAATKKYVDSYGDNNFMKLEGNHWEGRNLPISNVANPTLQQQAATKNYVDNIIAGIVAAGNNVIVVDTVATMKAVDLQDGMFATTAGYAEINDGSGFLYAIRAAQPGDVDEGTRIVVLDNGNVAERIDPITHTVGEYETFDNAVLDADAYNVYTGRTYVIDETITLTSEATIFNKVFSNCTFILNTTMFTWSAPYLPIPDFVNCVFIGNGNYIVDEGLYCSKSKFVNCIFNDCGIINHGNEFQSARFIACRFMGTTNLVQAKILNDFEINSCQFEANFNACIADTSENDNAVQQSSVQAFRVINTIIEGQKADSPVLFKFSKGGSICIDNCYFELVRCGLMDIIPGIYPVTVPLMNFLFTRCKFSVGREPFINIDAHYENSSRVYIKISDNGLVDDKTQHFLSTTTFPHLTIENNGIDSHVLLTNDITNVELGERNNIKVLEFWCDGTLSEDTSDTTKYYSPAIGSVFGLFAGVDSSKYTTAISARLVESVKDSNDNDPQDAWLRPRVYRNSGAYYAYLDILKTSDGTSVTQGKYKIRIAYVG